MESIIVFALGPQLFDFSASNFLAAGATFHLARDTQRLMRSLARGESN